MIDFVLRRFYLHKKEKSRQREGEFDSMTRATECESEEATSAANARTQESANWDGNGASDGHYWLVLKHASQNEEL